MSERVLTFTLDITTTLAEEDNDTASMGFVQSWLEDNGYDSELTDYHIETPIGEGDGRD